MSREFTDGAEFADLLFWTTTNTVSVVSSTPTPRSGNWCYKISNSANKALNTEQSEGYLRFGFITSTLNSAKRLPTIRKTTTEIGSLRINVTTSRIEAYIGTSTLVGTSTSTISLNSWYLIEFYLKMHDTTGRFIVKIDGNIEIDFTGDTKPGADTAYDNFNWSPAAGYDALDDLAFNTVVGTYDNSWCNDGRVILLTPDGNDTTLGLPWTGSDGDTTDNYLLVDEYPHDSDTTYVKATVAGRKDVYTLSAYDGVNKSILRVWAECRARKTTASGVLLYMTVVPSGISPGDPFAWYTTLTMTYNDYVGSGFLTNPYTELAWTDTDLDNTKLVIVSSG